MADFQSAVKKINANLQKIMEELQKKEVMDAIGQVVSESIAKRTRQGSGVKEYGEEKEKLAALKPSYVNFREKTIKLDTTTTPGKSNLTLTGEMLSDIYHTAEEGKVTIGFRSLFSNNKAYWAHFPEGKNAGRAPRPFFHFSKTEIKRAYGMLRAKMKAVISDLF